MRTRLIPTLALLAACSSAETREAHEMLELRMNDPSSVQYQKEVVTPAAICGEFNAKNLMGGYVGFKEYVYLKRERQLMLEGGEHEDVWRRGAATILACDEGKSPEDVAGKLAAYDNQVKASYQKWSDGCKKANYSADASACATADFEELAYNSILGVH